MRKNKYDKRSVLHSIRPGMNPQVDNADSAAVAPSCCRGELWDGAGTGLQCGENRPG